jgi:Uma2 family endonuclease
LNIGSQCGFTGETSDNSPWNMKTSTKPFTYDDYLALPDDGKRYEIIGGELSMTPAPSTRHQEIQTRLSALLFIHVDKHSLGTIYSSPTDLALSLVDVVQPDILFVAQNRSHIIAEKNIVGIPNLIVEILSPFSTKRDHEEKLDLYQRHALPEYWIVDPENQTVEVFVYSENRLEKVQNLKIGDQLHTSQIPGLILEIAEMFK